jgi:hypothetical protein
MINDPTVLAAVQGFRRIYLEGLPIMLQRNETAFLAFLCMVAGIDALSGYRFDIAKDQDRFVAFIRSYFPPEYTHHAAKLYLFRCRMLHNSSPAFFTVVHAAPAVHLGASALGDPVLDDGTFFAHFKQAAEKLFAELESNAALQQGMLARLSNVNRGGALFTAG